MKITKREMWESIYIVLPKIKIAREAGIYFNLPSLLKDAAVELFITNYNPDDCTIEYIRSCNEIRSALRELSILGMMTFKDE